MSRLYETAAVLVLVAVVIYGLVRVVSALLESLTTNSSVPEPSSMFFYASTFMPLILKQNLAHTNCCPSSCSWRLMAKTTYFKFCSCSPRLGLLPSVLLPLVLWRCWLGGRKGIRPVKKRVVGYWHGYLSGARCRLAYMAQLMPLPLTVSCFSKIQIGFTFLVPAHPGSPGKGLLNGCLFSRPVVVILPNFIKIGWTVMEISRFNAFQYGSRLLSCIFKIQIFNSWGR